MGIGPRYRRRFSRARQRLANDDGWLIVEIMMGALVLVIGALAIYSGLDGASKTSGKNRNRSVASFLAQQDQERMREMDATALSNYSNSSTIKVGGVPYTVTSTASFVSDSSGSVSCTNSSTTAQYLRIRSSVADPANQNAPVVMDSLLSPKPADGGAAVQIIDRNGNGVPGVNVALQQSPFSSITTDSQGCSLFGFLDSGTQYGVSFSQPGYVDATGTNAVTNAAITSVPGSTTLTQFQYDQAGAVNVNFVTPSGTPTNATSLSAYNAHIPLTPSLHSYTPLGSGTGVSSTVANNLFPFTDAYTFFSGQCTAEMPPSTSAKLAAATAIVSPGSSSQSVTVNEPPINVQVKTQGFWWGGGSNPVSGASVTVNENDSGCSDSYTDTTNSSGNLNNPNYPYGNFFICARSGNTWGTTTIANTSDSGTGTAKTITLSSNSRPDSRCP